MQATIEFDIIGRRCPNCGKEGMIEILKTEWRFRCRACNSRTIDPWAIGPWDTNKIILDTVQGERVSFYLSGEQEPEPERDIDERWGDFFREVFKDHAKRVVREKL